MPAPQGTAGHGWPWLEISCKLASPRRSTASGMYGGLGVGNVLVPRCEENLNGIALVALQQGTPKYA